MSNIPKIMPGRYENIEYAIQGIDSSHTYLVGVQNGNFAPVVTSDDTGIFIFAQFFHNLFNFNTNQIIYLFYFLSFFIGFSLFSYGLYRFFPQKKTRVLGLILISLFTMISFYVRDVYIASFLATALVPISLYALLKQKNIFSTLSLGVILGTAITFINYFRIYSATGLLIFIIAFALLLWKTKWKNRALFITGLFIGSFLLNTSFNHLVNKRDIFLKENNIKHNNSTQHHIWHSLYIGFGYIGNAQIPQYLDEVAGEKVKTISPSTIYCSQEYFDILKKETISFIQQNPKFVLQTLIAKTSMVILFFLIFGGIGIFYTIKYSFYTLEQVPFLLALGFNSIFGILVVPRVSYLLGFIGFSILYSIYFYNKKVELQH